MLMVITKRSYNHLDPVDRKGAKVMTSANLKLNKNVMLGKWDDFLDNRDSFHPYSPEYHRVIRSGNGLSSKSYSDIALYAQHMNDHENVEYSFPSRCIPYAQRKMEKETLKEYRNAIRQIPDDDTEKDARLLLESIFQGLYDLHTTIQVIPDGETTFNSLFLFPFLRSVARAISHEVDTAKTDFCKLKSA